MVAVAEPPGVVTTTSTRPAACAGVVTVICVGVSVEIDADVPPNVTVVAPPRFDPLMVTMVPPAVGPAAGDTPAMPGGAKKVYWSAALVALVPPTVVTLTSTVPAPAGETALIDVALFTVNEVAGVAPNVTAIAPFRFVPVIATAVPPALGPPVGDTLVTVGAAT